MRREPETAGWPGRAGWRQRRVSARRPAASGKDCGRGRRRPAVPWSDGQVRPARDGRFTPDSAARHTESFRQVNDRSCIQPTSVDSHVGQKRSYTGVCLNSKDRHYTVYSYTLYMYIAHHTGRCNTDSHTGAWLTVQRPEGASHTSMYWADAHRIQRYWQRGSPAWHSEPLQYSTVHNYTMPIEV